MPLFFGGALAFVFAVLAIYVDCYQAIRKNIWCVPRQFWRSKSLLILAAICGGIAALAFWVASQSVGSQDAGWLDTILGSKIANVYLRGIYTGLAVLALIRAKLVQIKDIDVGPEFFYNEGRLICLRGIRLSWASWSNSIGRNLQIAIGKPSFDRQLQDFITAAIADADPQLKTSFETQLSQIVQSKPTSAIAPIEPSWIVYYQALLRLALETCGTKPLVQAGLQP